MVEQDIVILIPTLRNAEQLDIVLNALNSQDFGSPSNGDFSIALVGPTGDPGHEIAKERGALWIDDKGSRNRADACNVGIAEIDCDIMLFTDDDVIPPANWVGNLVRWFEREEVGGVGGPNFAPDEDPFWAKAADVAFTAKYVTAGTRYGKVPPGELVEVDHNPGCNSAYRKHILDEVGGFEKGCIGAEDVVLDEKIRKAGYRLWFDPTAIMPHHRRVPIKPYMQQLRNYGYVRTLANKRFPDLAAWSHSAVGLFPALVVSAIIAFIWGAYNGGIAWPNFWDMSLSSSPMEMPRIIAHTTASLGFLYLLICFLGGALGNSPHRTIMTVLVSPILIFLAHWAYGSGVVRGWKQIYLAGGAEAGMGVQLDDKDRSGQ